MPDEKFEKIIHALDNGKIKYYDDEINTPELKFIKAIVPYIDFKYQKQIAYLVKIFECEMLMSLYSQKESNSECEKNKMEDIFNESAFKNLEPENQELIKNFIRDIDGKSPMESVNIIMEYNKKMPKNITEEQKNEIINLLLKRMSPEKKQQFLDFYSMFMKK